ncbi:MAG: hypothetical protein WC588_00265 [Candidatus Micrarchaeia archaeon]
MNRAFTIIIAAIALCLFAYGCLAAIEQPLDPRHGEPPPTPPQDSEPGFMPAGQGQNASINMEIPPLPPS